MFTAYRRLGENRYQERYGLDFEDFAPGQRFRHRPGVTLSQQDNADEALDTQNGAMLHYDAHYAAATAWQRPLMVSTLTLQRLVGMASKTYGQAPGNPRLRRHHHERPAVRRRHAVCGTPKSSTRTPQPRASAR